MSNPSHGTGRFFAVREDNDLIRVDWEQGITITDDDARQLIDRLAEISPLVCGPMLVNLNGMVSLSRGSLSSFAGNLNISAMALVGHSAVDRLLAGFFIGVHRPPYPTCYFDSEKAGEDWLLGRHDLDPDGDPDGDTDGDPDRSTFEPVELSRPPEPLQPGESLLIPSEYPGCSMG